MPFMPVLSKILSTKKPSPLSSLVGKIKEDISIRKLSSSPCGEAECSQDLRLFYIQAPAAMHNRLTLFHSVNT